MDEALAAVQRFETSRKVLEMRATRVLAAGLHDELTTKYSKSSVREQAELIAGVQTDITAQEQPGWAKELFKQQAEILERLNNFQQSGEHRGKKTP